MFFMDRYATDRRLSATVPEPFLRSLVHVIILFHGLFRRIDTHYVTEIIMIRESCASQGILISLK